jgi:sugar/nucleoside kinase (ribokinase family)
MLSPLLHLNREEILTFTHTSSIDEAAQTLYKRTQNTIIITDGPEGSYYYDPQGLHHIPAVSTHVIDTIGAGDAHIGAIIASLKLGHDYKESLLIANKIAAKVVATKGSLLSSDSML